MSTHRKRLAKAIQDVVMAETASEAPVPFDVCYRAIRMAGIKNIQWLKSPREVMACRIFEDNRAMLTEASRAAAKKSGAT